MKIFTFIFTLTLILFTACSQEYKAKKAIREELNSTLPDFKSYEPIKFGKLEVGYSRYIDLPEVKNFRNVGRSLFAYQTFLDSVRSEFSPEVIGWQMLHSYRAKNDAGKFEIHHDLLVLDNELSKVTMIR